PSGIGPDGLLLGAHGPLLVFGRQIEEDGRIVDAHEVVTYDLGGRRTVATFRVDGAHPRIVLSGHRVLVNRDLALISYALDGTDAVRLWTAEAHEYIESVEPSEDGRLVALNVICR